MNHQNQTDQPPSKPSEQVKRMFLEFVTQQSQKIAESSDIVRELAKRLDAFWNKAYNTCIEFFDSYDRGYAELENEPLECEVSSARMRIEEGDKISIDYSAVHIYDSCISYSCGPYDEEENPEEAYMQCRETCLEEAERVARAVLGEYRRVIERWAKKRDVKYTEELKRDELNFTLIIKLHSSGG